MSVLSVPQPLVFFIYNRKISKIEDTLRFIGFYVHEIKLGDYHDRPVLETLGL